MPRTRKATSDAPVRVARRGGSDAAHAAEYRAVAPLLPLPFVGGVTAAASGAIAGACYVLARRAITDVPTALMALVALALLWRFKVPEPVLIAGDAAAGLLIVWARGS